MLRSLLESILTPSHPLGLSSGHVLSSVRKYKRSIPHISRPITNCIPGFVLADMKFRDSGNGFGRLATSRKGCGIRARPRNMLSEGPCRRYSKAAATWWMHSIELQFQIGKLQSNLPKMASLTVKGVEGRRITGNADLYSPPIAQLTRLSSDGAFHSQ